MGSPTDSILTIVEGRLPLRSECPISVTAQPPPDLGSMGLISTPDISTHALTYPSTCGNVSSGGDIVETKILPSWSSFQVEQRMKSLADVGQMAV